MSVNDYKYAITEYYCSLTQGTCYENGLCSNCEEPDQWVDLRDIGKEDDDK